MFKTHSDSDNSQAFEIKLNEYKCSTLIIFYEKQDQLPTLNIPNIELILISNDAKDLEEGDIQSNFFCKNVCFVSKDTFIDMLNQKKKIKIEDKKSFSIEIFTSTIKHLDKNIQNCLNGASIALELELIAPSKDVLVISGSGRYLDTLILLEPSPLQKMHLSKIREIICQPEITLD